MNISPFTIKVTNSDEPSKHKKSPDLHRGLSMFVLKKLSELLSFNFTFLFC